MQAEEKRIVAIVPAYNEELTIAFVVLLALPHVHKVIVVSDGSSDRTIEIAKAAGADVLEMPKNLGKASAIMAGFNYCLRYDPFCVVMIDGDGQMDAAEIPRISEPILKGEADLVIGSRYIGKRAHIPMYRKLGQIMLNSAQNMSSDVKVTDSQSGYRALSREALKNLNFTSNAYNIETDMIVQFAKVGLRIVEVPFTVRYDVPNGHKERPLNHGMSVMGRLIGFAGYRRPLIVFGIPGLLFFIIGLILCMLTFFEMTIIFQWTLTLQGVAGVSIFGLGMLLIISALILNSLSMLMDQRLHAKH